MPFHKLYDIMYIDDMIITASNSHSLKVEEFIKLLHARFSLKDMGVLHYFLGIKVSSLPNQHLLLKQSKYMNNILDNNNLI